MNKIKDLGIVIFFSLAIRFFLPYWNVIFEEKYHFLGTRVPYYFQPDSYSFYMELRPYLSEWLIYLLPIISLVIGLVVFYVTLVKLKVKTPVLGTIVLSLFPTFFSMSYFGYIDTPPYIFLCMAILNYSVISLLGHYDNGTWKNWYNLIYLWGIIVIYKVLAIVWNQQGVYMVAFVLFFAVGISLIRIIRYKVLFFFLGCGFFFWKIYGKMAYFLVYSAYIQELERTNYLLFYFFTALVLFSIIMLILNKRTMVVEYLSVSFIIYCTLTILMKRFSYFSIIFGVMIIFIAISKHQLRFMELIMWFVLLVSLIHVSFVFQDKVPFMERELQASLEGLEDREIIGDWGHGHIYEAFTKGKVTYKAKADIEAYEIWIEALDTGNYILFDDIARTDDYYVIITTLDTDKIYNYSDYFVESSFVRTEDKSMIVLRRK